MKPFEKKKNLLSKALAILKGLDLLRWKRIFEILSKKEKILFCSFSVLALASFAFLLINLYSKNTILVPATGGTYSEGVVGKPRFINPIFATSDVDRDLSELVFSGLLKYNEKGEIVLDLAKEYETEEGSSFTFKLKEAFWHDGQPVTAVKKTTFKEISP